MSPKSAYLKRVQYNDQIFDFSIHFAENSYRDVFDTDSVGLCSGAYGWDAVGVDAFDAPGLWCC